MDIGPDFDVGRALGERQANAHFGAGDRLSPILEDRSSGDS